MISFARPIRNLLLFIVLTLAIFVILAIAPIQIAEGISVPPLATTWRVPSDFPTIQQAINSAVNGDTILVSRGFYTENIGFGGKDITLQSVEGPNVTKISAPSSGGTVVDIGPQGQIIGFKIINGLAYFGAGMAVHGTNTIIKNNIFENNTAPLGGSGAAILGNVSSPVVEKNVFRNNRCYNELLSGVIMFVNDSSPQIINNIFVDNPCPAITMPLPEGPAPFVTNNTIVRNRVGLMVDARVSTTAHLYQNNIMVSNTIGVKVDFGSPPDFPTLRNNLVFGNSTNYVGIPDQTGINGNKSGDPLFIDPIRNNFELRAGSLAIDSGNNAKCPVDDFRGVRRPQNKICDIGAFEFQEPAATPTAVKPSEVPEADTLLLIGFGLGAIAIWVGWQKKLIRNK